jgi:hypothetical protein
MGAIQDQIISTVGGWDGVTVASHRFGGVEFRLGKVELGHIHGDHMADLPFPTGIRNELVERGDAVPHLVLPESGWVTRRIADAGEVDAVIGLFRLNYERLTARRRPGAGT